MKIHINAQTALAGEELVSFLGFLQENATENRCYFNNNTIDYQDSKDNHYHFAQALLFRETALPTNTPQHYDCFFIQNVENHDGNALPKKLGEGSFGVIYEIETTIQVSNLGFIPCGYTETQVVKIQNHCACTTIAIDQDKPCLSAHNSQAQLLHEYEICKKLPQFQIEHPIIDAKKTSYTIMNKFSGDSLADILEEDQFQCKKGKPLLTIQQRLDLTRALLQALDSQVYQQRLIHCDIKPDNIMVVLGPPIVVNILDYAFALPLDTNNTAQTPIRMGTIPFIPREFWLSKHPVQTPKRDVFAMGRVLELLWANDQPFYGLETNEEYMEKLNTNTVSCADRLFWALPPTDRQMIVSANISTPIKQLCHSMLSNDLANRPSITEAISKFQFIHQQFTHWKENSQTTTTINPFQPYNFFKSLPPETPPEEVIPAGCVIA